MRHPANLVIIGASTGGTRVLPEMLRRLPRMPAAILLVQHIPEFITPSFLGTLQRASRMPVAVAADGLSLTEGAVILTPGGLHCSVMENHRLRVAPGEKVNFVIPSVDVTMQSVRVALPGQRLFGVILTGMGRDGAAGLAHLKRLYQRNFRDTEWFKECLAGRFTKTDVLDGTYIQDLHADSDVARAYNSDGLVLGFSAPIKDASGKVIAIWHNAANFSLVEEILTDAYKHLKERGLADAELTVVGRKGRVLMDYDPLRNGGREAVEHDASVLFKVNLAESGHPAAKLAIEGKSGHLIASHIRKNITQLCGYATCDGELGFPGYRWGILVRVPEDKALAAMLAARWQVTIVVLGSVLGLLIVGFWLARTLARPLLVGVEALGRIGEEVASAAGEVGNASQTVAHSASEQAASLEETSASIEEMNAVTKRNAENDQRGKEIASSARSSAQDGSARIIEMSRSLATIKSAVAELDGAVREAQASNQEVSKIIKTIDEIAFQTNLLALNAAVEAARAGEAGMGFAVVADEVRALAQRSAQAAKDTTEKIESAIKRSELGGAASRKVAGSLTEVETTARQLEQAFQGIAQQVNSLDAMVAEIAAASQEQTQGIGEISLATTEMDKVTQSNAANAEETASAASHLNTQVGMLLQVAGQLQTVITGATANSHSAAQEMPEATPAPARAKLTGTRSVTNGHARNGKGLNGASSRAHTNGNGSGASSFDIPMPDPSAAPAGGFRDF